jgi:hypothetical protein
VAKDEIKSVPLVTYRESGERVEIGTAEVHPDNTIRAQLDGPVYAALSDGMLTGYSFGLGASMPDRDAGLLDALASVRAENRRLRRDLADVMARLQEQLEEARVMRADVAELARQAGVLLGEQVAKP